MRILVLNLFLASAIFGTTGGVIDWVAVGAASAAASAVTSGASMFQSLTSASNYRVMCKIEVENWTKYPLWAPASHINSGIIESPPVAVKPGQKEMFITHKTGDTATGTSGTASWQITGKNKRAVVMWSCPYSFDFHSNWLGVGLTTSDGGHYDWFKQMYYESSGRGLNFVRGEYYYHTRTISTNDGKFEVTGTMGTSHHATANVIVRPLDEKDLAPTIQESIRKYMVG